MRKLVLLFLVIFVSATTLTCQKTSLENDPNIVLIVIDDLGWADLGFMGNKVYDTPNLDKLASEGMVFIQAYAPAANCAPSRACILSGRNTPFHGIYTVGNSERGKSKDRKLIPVKNKTVLQDSIETIADFLKSEGYVTASIGKWHLGDTPLSQGFDVNVAGNKAGLPRSYFSPYKNPQLRDGPVGEHLTDRLTDEALSFITDHKEERFFLYLPHYTVHTPLQGKKELVAKYEDKISDEVRFHATYGAMVENMDANVGRLLQGINDSGLKDNTIVIFTSDNGGITSISRQDPLRAGKGSYYEGGIRVPLVIRWPKMIVNNTKCEIPVSGLDFYPTLVDIVGGDVDSLRLEGVSLKKVMLDGAEMEERSLYWHFPIYLEAYEPRTDGSRDPIFRTRPGSVIRRGEWKLHEYFEDGGLELYNLSEDISEATNVFEKYPEITQDLYKDLVRWRSKNKAIITKEPNPDFEDE